jgi:hypothetical protein
MARTVHLPTSSTLRLRAARGEGRTLILDAEIPADIASVMNVRDVAASFAHGICANPSSMTFFTEGRTLRVNLSAPGRAPASTTIDRCPPGPVGQGVNIDTYVQMYRGMLGRDLGEGSTFTAARAEGQTLVLVMNGRRGWRAGASPATITQDFLGGFCEPGTGNAFFDGQRSLRIDTTEDGGDLVQGVVATGCPARPAAR